MTQQGRSKDVVVRPSTGVLRVGEFAPRMMAELEGLKAALELGKRLRPGKRPNGGRPRADYHHEWATVFLRLRSELNDGYESPVDGEPNLNNIELSQLVVDELGLSVTSRAVWDAVKPLI